MERMIWISNEDLSLAEYIPDLDTESDYSSWQDRAVQEGYNFQMRKTLEEFSAAPVKSRFHATILRNSDCACIGFLSLSPENTLPDLAIKILQPFRHQGYGTQAFSLGIKYCFESLKLERIYAGCYENNSASLKMLSKCGFQANPAGNQHEFHYLTGAPIVQMDFVLENPSAVQTHSCPD